jgi:flagellar motor switch protein FliG
MKIDSMDSSRKVAIVLLSLDRGFAAEILGRMPRELVERVTLSIANAGNVTREEQESVLNEFKWAFLSRPLMQPAGPETARELLERTLDKDEIEPIQQRFEEQVQAGSFAFLHIRHADDIRMLIEVEHSQTIAVVVSQLPSALSARVLAGFEPTRQADILSRLAAIGPTDKETLDEISSTLQSRIGKAPIRAGGIVSAAEVLREIAPAKSHEVVKLMENSDRNLAASIRQTLFSFQELEFLDDETLSVIVNETSQFSWSIALKGCSEKLRQRIFRLLDSDAANELKRQMKSNGPLSLSEINSTQQQIAAAILALEAEERIRLPKQDSRQPNRKDRLKQAI